MDLNRKVEIAFECQDRSEYRRRTRRLLARSVWLDRTRRLFVWLGLDIPAWLANVAEQAREEAQLLRGMHNGR